MSVQKFFKGDLVKIGNLPPSMSHFPSNCEAIVLYSDKENLGHSSRNQYQYALFILNKDKNNNGFSAWYHEDQLTFVREDAFDKLPKSNYDRQVWEAMQARNATLQMQNSRSISAILPSGKEPSDEEIRANMKGPGDFYAARETLRERAYGGKPPGGYQSWGDYWKSY